MEAKAGAQISLKASSRNETGTEMTPEQIVLAVGAGGGVLLLIGFVRHCGLYGGPLLGIPIYRF